MSEDINQQILAELRNVTSMVRRLFWLLLLLLVAFAFLVVFTPRPHSHSDASTPSWDSVQTAMRKQEFNKALIDAQNLVGREPNYYYGEAYLGVIYLAKGDATNAETHFALAYKLFPNEQSEKDLAAVRKRLAEQQPIKLLSK